MGRCLSSVTLRNQLASRLYSNASSGALVVSGINDRSESSNPPRRRWNPHGIQYKVRIDQLHIASLLLYRQDEHWSDVARSLDVVQQSKRTPRRPVIVTVVGRQQKRLLPGIIWVLRPSGCSQWTHRVVPYTVQKCYLSAAISCS